MCPRYKSGFLGGYLGHSIGDKLNYGDGIGAVAARTTAMAVGGGASAKLGGGKFANGAVSSAFVHLFNNEAPRMQRAAKLAAARWNRSVDNIYVTGHRVGAVGPYHTAIEYVDGSGQSHWLSAGPEGTSTEGLVSLVSSPYRPSDTPGNNSILGRVIPPSGMSAASYFQELQTADAFYCDCADYDLFPGAANGYNSNSYVNSLIGVTGGSASVNMNGFVGGGNAIPEMNFW